jgi:hypothetical protein
MIIPRVLYKLNTAVLRGSAGSYTRPYTSLAQDRILHKPHYALQRVGWGAHLGARVWARVWARVSAAAAAAIAVAAVGSADD